MKKLAKQIFDRFDKQIVEATTGTGIPPAFIAGLIANEAGKDRSGNIVRGATRFEPHVFAALKSIRDRGYRLVKGGAKVTHYSHIKQSQIADASDVALRALATSYEATQIMGWHVINNLRCTIADLRNPDKHFFYTVKLLQLNGFPKNATEAQMDREMRQWNTGSETGKTYHANYVPNAQRIRAEYRLLERGRVSRSVEERVDVRPEIIEAEAIHEPGVMNLGPEHEACWGMAVDEQPISVPTATQTVESLTDTITAHIPKITTARITLTRIFRSSSVGVIVTSILASLEYLPWWMPFVFVFLAGMGLMGLISVFLQYYPNVFSFAKEVYIRAASGEPIQLPDPEPTDEGIRPRWMGLL